MGEIPCIIIDGKEYTLPKPKIKLWRSVVKFKEAQQKGGLNEEKLLDEMTNLVVVAFNNPAITKEAVEENLEIEELVKLFSYIGQQATGVANLKAAQLPNGVTPAGT